MKLKNWLNISLGFAITIVCIYLAFREVPPSDLEKVISGGNYIWLIPACLAQLFAILVRAGRWLILLDRKTELEASAWTQEIGYLFTNLFPFRLGKSARVLVMSEQYRLPLVQVAGTAVVERLLDVGTMIFALLIVLLAIFRETSIMLIDKVCARFTFLPKSMIMAR